MAEIKAVPVGGGRSKSWGAGGNYAIPRPADRQQPSDDPTVDGEESVESGTSSIRATPVGTPVSASKAAALRRREALNPRGFTPVAHDPLPGRQDSAPRPTGTTVSGTPVGTPVAKPVETPDLPKAEKDDQTPLPNVTRLPSSPPSVTPSVDPSPVRVQEEPSWVEDREGVEGGEVEKDKDSLESSLPRVERVDGAKGRGGSLPHRPHSTDEEETVTPLPRRASASARTGRPKAGERAPGVQSALVTSEDWEIDLDNPALDEVDSVPEEKAREFTKGSKQIRIVPRDLEIIRLLARFRYSLAIQVARYIDSSKKATDQRLTKLSKAGLLRKEEVTRGQTVWTPTAWGLSASDLDFRAIGEGGISYVTMAHTLGLVNIGIELEIGGENLLGLSDWPQMNRKGLDGSIVPGETLVTEREIRQAQQRWKKDLDRREVENAFPLALSAWMQSDRSTPSPELQVGNEAMFIIYATKSNRADHVPDLVVARPRNEDGTPASLAVELELNPKPVKEWTRILESFAESDLYGHLYYFTHKKSIADTLNRIAAEIGMTDMFSVKKYTPRNGGLPFWG